MKIYYSKILMQCDRCLRRLCNTNLKKEIGGFIVLLCSTCNEAPFLEDEY